MIQPYIPIYMEPPNKFIRYEEREFNDSVGNGGVVRVTIYEDKNGKIKE